MTIYGKAGSYAEKFAKDNKIPFSTGKPGDPTTPAAKTAQTLKLTKTYSKAYGNKPFKLNAKLSKGNGKLSYMTNSAVIKKNKTTSTTLKKLTKGRKYYVKIRAYKNVKINRKAEKLYVSWSNVKQRGNVKR